MQHCDSTCQHCARHFFNWLKSQQAKFSLTPKPGSRAARSGPGNFGEAAATSVRAP